MTRSHTILAPPTITKPQLSISGQGCPQASPTYSGEKPRGNLAECERRSVVPGGTVDFKHAGTLSQRTTSSTAERSQLRPSDAEGVGTAIKANSQLLMSSLWPGEFTPLKYLS